jgi:hydrogenase nickel incorporation protein HypA/HybF
VEGVGVHEIGLCEGVLETVLRHAKGRTVSRVRLRAGVRHAVDSASMEQVFLLVAQGTPAAGAVVEVTPVAARLECRECGARADTFDLLAVCPQCGSGTVDVTGGDDLVLESIDYAAPAAPAGPAAPAAERPPVRASGRPD